MTKQKVVVDADFVMNITDSIGARGLEAIQNDLNLEFIVHPYIAEHELYLTKYQDLFSSGCLKRLEYSDFLDEVTNPFDYTTYIINFRELYFLLNQMDIPEKEVFVRKSKTSRGEIHSALMASILKIPLFFSNDHSASLIRNQISTTHFQLITKNTYDILKEIACLPQKSLKKTDVRVVMNQLSSKKPDTIKAQIREINKLWDNCSVALASCQ